MEILSSIWNIMTTENEMVTKIITAPTVIIEDWIAFLLIVTILKIDYTPKKKYIYIISLSIISLVTEFFIPAPFNVFLNFLLMFVLVKLLLRQNIIKSILCTIIPTIVFALATTLFLNPFLKALNLSYNQTATIPIYRFIYLIFLYIIVLFILVIIRVKNLKFNILEEFTANNHRIILLNLFFGFFILCIQAVLTVYYVSIVPIVITLLNFISLAVYFFISFYSLNRTMRLQETTQNLETAENYNETLSYLYDNVKAFQHDFNNMIFIIGGYIEANDTEGLKKYYKNLEKDSERVNNVALLNPKLINNSGIYNLLMSKYKKANSEKVEIKLEFFFDFEKLQMPIYEFSRMLGILLDNSIEAAKETDEKQVNIIFRDSSRNNTQIISIENTYNNKDVDTNKIFEKGITEKKEHMGMGLWEVKQILNRNNNVNLITTKDNTYFKQTLEIYY